MRKSETGFGSALYGPQAEAVAAKPGPDAKKPTAEQLKALKAWLDKVKHDRDEKLKQWVADKVERNSIKGTYNAGPDDPRGKLLTVEPKCGQCEDSCPWEGKFLDVDWCLLAASSGYFFMRGFVECT
jgi:hypothetical protein